MRLNSFRDIMYLIYAKAINKEHSSNSSVTRNIFCLFSSVFSKNLFLNLRYPYVITLKH